MADGPTLYDVHALGISAQTKPRDLADVSRALQLIERWGNTIPWWPPTVVASAFTPALNVNTTGYATVTNLAVTVTPTRVGQVIVAFVNLRANRAIGADQLVMRALVNGVATTFEWVLPNQTNTHGTGMVFVTAADLQPITIQIQGRTVSGTTWNITTESSITVLAI